ncbi:MAG: xanthine dehydrogenase accessory protein XdhC, partial [Alphaproteobacteria bacterium]
VLITRAEGSAPREAGTAMLVWQDGQYGTIGGGALEWQALAAARRLLPDSRPWARESLALALGPALGQCCGGAVRLLMERFGAEECTALEDLSGAGGALCRPEESGIPPSATPHAGWIREPFAAAPPRLFLYGAGHVGRAVAQATQGLALRLIWIDDASDRFPAEIPAHAERLVAANPADAVRLASPVDMHLVMTYSHSMDLEICHRVLGRPFAWAGLIGSPTKAARFRKRLRALGHDERRVAALICPVGDRSLGKSPSAIALGIAVDLCRHLAATAEGREGAA